MLISQRKRLDKLQAKTRTQWEKARDQYWHEIFNPFPWHERDAAQDALAKWFDTPADHKTDDDAVAQHFTEAEVGLLARIDAIWKEPRLATMRDTVETLYAALQACERAKA